MRAVIALLVTALLTLPAYADTPRPRAGLLWNDSGQPATLPLQIRSQAGQDHVIILTRPDATAPAMAGYIRGGEFFRLLVPPGDWVISIVSGQDWQGEEALFGPDSRRIELAAPLNFIAGESTMNGHVLTIGDGPHQADVTVAPRRLCRIPYRQPAPQPREAPAQPRAVITLDPATPHRLDPRDPLSHDRLSDGRIDPRDPLARDRLSDGRLDPRDPLAHDRLARRPAPVQQPRPPAKVEPLTQRQGKISYRTVICD